MAAAKPPASPVQNQWKKIRVVIKAMCAGQDSAEAEQSALVLFARLSLGLPSFVCVKNMTVGVKMKYPGEINSFSCRLDLPSTSVQPLQKCLFLALPCGGGNETICGASKPASRRDNETSEEAGRALISLVCTEIKGFN